MPAILTAMVKTAMKVNCSESELFGNTQLI